MNKRLDFSALSVLVINGFRVLGVQRHCQAKTKGEIAVRELKKAAFIPVLICVLSGSALADFQFTFDGHTYEVITSGVTWAEASTAAQDNMINGESGYLARIDSDEENDELFSQLANNIDPSDFENTLAPDGGGASYVWIGANDIQTEGEWIWVDNGAQFWQGDSTGSAVDSLYNNWGNEPDDFNGQDAAGMALNDWPLGIAGQWNDVDTDNRLYYIIEYSTVSVEFAINAGLNDAWFNSDTAGQGFFIIVFEDTGIIFMAWFTYDTELPPDDVAAFLGAAEHRWLTAQGPYSGNTATLDVFQTEGGIFDMSEPAPTTGDPIGTITIVWTDCENGVLTYNINPPGVMGEIPITRIVPDNVVLCEALNQQ